MSAPINTGGPAFPEIRIRSGDNYNPPTKLYYGGMTLRDYFAAKAMQQLMAETKGDSDDTPIGGPKWEMHEVAALAYEQADAMLAARQGGAA